MTLSVAKAAMSAASLSRRALLKGSVASLALIGGAKVWAIASLPMRDPFIERLIKKMTLEEKAGQLSIFTAKGPGRSVNPLSGLEPSVKAIEEEVKAGRATGYFNGFNPYLSRRLQEVAVTQSRLGIPLIFAADVIHGLRTGYPVPLAEAASFDADLCYRTARMTAVEATGFGIQWTFAPMVDIARDQRWGRVVEGAGEDPWLAARLGVARVRGFQGADLRADDSLLACPKHFAAYGAVEGGKEYSTVEISETTLRQIHLPPFKSAIDAGALTIMSSFNDIGGVPATADSHLLTGILRKEWQFRGLVVSDYESEKELIAHGFAADEADAVFKAVSAGCDVSMQSGLYNACLPDLVRSGRLAERVVDEAVRRVLRVKKALGLFSNPYRSLEPARAKEVERRADMIALSREAGRKAIVLLKNEGNILPLPKSGKRIAFVGPFVSDRASTLGPWMVFPDTASAISLEAGVRAALGPDPSVSFTLGSSAEKPITGGLEAAVAAARDSDVVVMYVGETATMSGEASSREAITIPAAQQALIEAVANTGKPLVILLKHGRALALEGAALNAAAIMCTWFLGSESGNAIADVLFGDHAPRGRLPVSFPTRSGQEPFYYNRRSTGRPEISDASGFKARYREVPDQALYPFGHGLGYSSVVYGTPRASRPTLSRHGSVDVSVTVTNAGDRPVHEVIQLYVHPQVSSVTQPIRALKDIRHVELRPKESETVLFTISERDFRYMHSDFTDMADLGRFDIWAAGSASTGEPITLTLTS